MKDSQLSDFPTAFVGTFPNLFLLRSWTRHNPETELFLFAAQEATRLKHQPQAPPTSCYPPPPHLQAENSTRRNSVINSLISQNTPPQCYPQNQAAKADCPPYSLTPRRHRCLPPTVQATNYPSHSSCTPCTAPAARGSNPTAKRPTPHKCKKGNPPTNESTTPKHPAAHNSAQSPSHQHVSGSPDDATPSNPKKTVLPASSNTKQHPYAATHPSHQPTGCSSPSKKCASKKPAKPSANARCTSPTTTKPCPSTSQTKTSAPQKNTYTPPAHSSTTRQHRNPSKTHPAAAGAPISPCAYPTNPAEKKTLHASSPATPTAK